MRNYITKKLGPNFYETQLKSVISLAAKIGVVIGLIAGGIAAYHMLLAR